MKRFGKQILVVLVLAMMFGMFHSGTVFAKKKYYMVESFREGRAKVNVRNGWNEFGKQGFINEKGEFVIVPKYDYVSYFNEGLAYVELGENMALLIKIERK